MTNHRGFIACKRRRMTRTRFRVEFGFRPRVGYTVLVRMGDHVEGDVDAPGRRRHTLSV